MNWLKQLLCWHRWRYFIIESRPKYTLADWEAQGAYRQCDKCGKKKVGLGRDFMSKVNAE